MGPSIVFKSRRAHAFASDQDLAMPVPLGVLS
jgi:hypothetical protein